MTVIWSAASVRHLHEVFEHLQGKSPGGAITIRRKILNSVRCIAQMPYSGRRGRIDGTYEAVVPQSPYIVVYQISSQTVEILGIWHGARQWPESF